MGEFDKRGKKREDVGSVGHKERINVSVPLGTSLHEPFFTAGQYAKPRRTRVGKEGEKKGKSSRGTKEKKIKENPAKGTRFGKEEGKGRS